MKLVQSIFYGSLVLALVGCSSAKPGKVVTIRVNREQNGERISEDIASVDAFLCKMHHAVKSGSWKCSNFDEEKEFFFEKTRGGASYNPQFKYEQPSVDYPSLLAKLDSLMIMPSRLSKVFEEKRDEIIVRIRLMQSIGNATEFSRFSIVLHGLPSKEVLDFATSFLSTHKPRMEEERTYSAEYAVKYMRDALREYNVNGWKVKLSPPDRYYKMQVSPRSKQIVVNRNESFSKSTLRGLKVHEIGVHVVRQEMGERLSLSLLAYGLTGWRETEEGLAVFNEEQNGTLTDYRLATLCGRAIAVDKAQRNDFYTVYKHLIDMGFSKDDAFTMTYRVKRGLKDTEAHGGFTEAHIYLSGYLKVREYVKSPKDFEELMKYGRIGINHVATLRTFFGGQLKRQLKVSGTFSKAQSTYFPLLAFLPGSTPIEAI